VRPSADHGPAHARDLAPAAVAAPPRPATALRIDTGPPLASPGTARLADFRGDDPRRRSLGWAAVGARPVGRVTVADADDPTCDRRRRLRLGRGGRVCPLSVRGRCNGSPYGLNRNNLVAVETEIPCPQHGLPVPFAAENKLVTGVQVTNLQDRKLEVRRVFVALLREQSL